MLPRQPNVGQNKQKYRKMAITSLVSDTSMHSFFDWDRVCAIGEFDWSTTKIPVISNHMLVVSHRNAFVWIYSNFVPKLVAMVTSLCPLCTGVSQMNSPMAQTLSQNQTMRGCVACNWSYGHFCHFLAYFGQNLVAVATSLRPLQPEISYLDWSTPITIPIP